MIFENAVNSTKQGDIGEARAIYEYTRLGFIVSRTLFDSAKYDLIIDDGEGLKRVQVKTSNYYREYGWIVGLKTSGGNRSRTYKQKRKKEDYDILFVLTSDNRCWSIPTDILGDIQSVILGTKKYQNYELN